MKTPLLLDSSFLIALMERPTSWQRDILEALGAHTPIILESVRDELIRLAGKEDRRARFAALALSSVVDRGEVVLERDGGGKPDDEILSFALSKRGSSTPRTASGAAVATLDSELIERLHASGILLVTLKGGRVSVFL